MVFTELFLSEATNPNTGEVVQAIRVKSDTREVFKVLNSQEELKDFGTKQEVLNSLVIIDGEYGKFARLPRHKKLEDLEW